MFVLLLAALSSFAGPAGAQPNQLQYVVIYAEFKPADTEAGGRVLDELASQGLASVGVIRFDVLQQVDRRNFFALFEIWSSAQTFAAFTSSSATQAIFTQLAPLLGAPLDERDGNLLAGTVNPRSRQAESRQIFVITHADIEPQSVGQAVPVLDTFVSDSASDRGVQTFALLSQTPTANHFHLIEVFANQQAFDAHVSAQHTLDFRTNLQPFIGAPYDERLYHFQKFDDDQEEGARGDLGARTDSGTRLPGYEARF
jgi:quinol monooxygenase YgiN